MASLGGSNTVTGLTDLRAGDVVNFTEVKVEENFGYTRLDINWDRRARERRTTSQSIGCLLKMRDRSNAAIEYAE